MRGGFRIQLKYMVSSEMPSALPSVPYGVLCVHTIAMAHRRALKHSRIRTFTHRPTLHTRTNKHPHHKSQNHQRPRFREYGHEAPLILKTTLAVTVPDAPRDSHCVLGRLLGRVLRMLLVLFVVLFTCGDAVTGGVKRAMDRALEAADTRGSSSSAREPHVQQLGGGVLRCLRQEDQPQLPLLPNLRRHWAERSMSSVTVQELAHSAASQGAHGHGSRQPKNLHRDLMTLFGTPRGAPAFIPMRNGPDFHPVLLPHVFFSELFERRSSLWEDSIRRPPRVAREFWQRLQHKAVVREHPHLPRARWAKTVPLGLHGDASPFHEAR